MGSCSTASVVAGGKTGTGIADALIVIDSGTLLQGRFLIEDQIGSGGMGAVYRAIDQKFGSQVAIKETFYGDTELSAAFEREARLLNGLHHPILPHVSDSFTENGGHFLVMEYIEGEDLSELLKRGEVFPVDTVIGWAFDLLDGLDYLHSQEPPVIHRDIKPNNLKITSRGRIVLLDFGMAKETSSNTLEARSVFGYSRRYSPLEQIEGTGTDERSDIFSLGASLYHLITGKPPADVLARASAIVAGKPDPLVPAKLVNPAVSESIASILNSALALNVEQRFASARAMSEALQEAISVSSVSQKNEEESAAFLSGGQTIASTFEAAPVTAQAQSDMVQDQIVSENVPSGSGFADTNAADSRPNTTAAALGGNNEKPFTALSAFENFRDRVRSSVPSSIPVIRVRKPLRLNYALLLPILLLSVGVVFLAVYGLSQRSDEQASSVVAPRIVPDSAGTEAATTSSAEEISEAETAPASELQAQQPVQSNDNAINPGQGPIATGENSTRRSTRDGDSEKKIARDRASESAGTDVRGDQKQRTASRRNSRRVAKPEFEQPSVSSIEAIMTGERRDRWVYERDPWIEDQLRRRRMRRMRRYQQPF